MILVTIGTTMPFDELIREIDQAVADGRIKDPVLAQTGNGEYEPRHCEHFRFRPDISDLMAKADLVVGHGGTGTFIEAMKSGTPFIAVANPRSNDDHQAQFLAKMAGPCGLIWTTNVSEVPALIGRALEHRPQQTELPHLADDLRDFIKAL